MYNLVFGNGNEKTSYKESGSNTLYIPISAEGTFVDLYMEEYAYATNNAKAGSNSFTFTYDMSVVPEPVSSILFISGGAILIFMYNRKRRE
ncbi:PEP-CTERM sorting domain-containing protein [Candidatus Poribacteria bacterium]|nr:PEP-CTERM sorting domain-containing protein [Candidatus Poribacteria bacterium]